MASLETINARIAALEKAIETVTAGRTAQWGDQMVTMVNLPDLEAALQRAERQQRRLQGASGYSVARFS